MRRAVKIFGGMLLVLMLALAVALYAFFGGMPAVIDGTELGPARLVKDGYVAAWVIGSEDGLIFVDAGNDPEAKALRAEVERRGLTPGDVRHILLTHGHPDHIAGAPRFPNATVYALQPEVALVEGRVGSHGPVTRFFPPKDLGVRVGRVVKDGDAFEIGEHRVEVFAIPGHTPGSAAWVVDDFLFLGDSADATVDGTMQDAVWPFTDDPAQNHASLVALAKRLNGREIRGAGFGHSGALTGGGALKILE